jgi:polyphosphate kinase
MQRNLDRRIEVTTPVYDVELKQELADFINIQLKDNTKARIFDEKMSNKYVEKSKKVNRCQVDFYTYLQKKHRIETA